MLLGVTAGVATAVAGTQPWFGGGGSSTSGDGAALQSQLAVTVDGADVPAVNALALVGLACWGVVLVSRGRFRQSSPCSACSPPRESSSRPSTRG